MSQLHSTQFNRPLIMSCSCCLFKKLLKLKIPSRIKIISSKVLTKSPETAGLPQSIKNFANTIDKCIVS